MKTTGYGLREAIKQHTLIMDSQARAFNGSLKAFRGEEKDAPEVVISAFLREEAAISKLQTAQMRYNLAVTVEYQGSRITLAEAIKLLGGIARAEKMWRSAAGPKEDRYSFHDADVRDVNQIRANPTITAKEAVKHAASVAKLSGTLRRLISTANAVEIEIEDLDPALFE